MNYELVYILTPKLTDQQAKEKAAEIITLIKRGADKIIAEDFWGKKELAYPIKHYDNGHYVAVQFSVVEGDVNNIDKNLRLTEEIIRFLLIKKNKLVSDKKKIRKSAVVDKVVEKEAVEKKKDSAEEIVNKEQKTIKSKAGIEELDKKLDDILEEIKD